MTKEIFSLRFSQLYALYWMKVFYINHFHISSACIQLFWLFRYESQIKGLTHSTSSIFKHSNSTIYQGADLQVLLLTYSSAVVFWKNYQNSCWSLKILYFCALISMKIWYNRWLTQMRGKPRFDCLSNTDSEMCFSEWWKKHDNTAISNQN